MFLVPLARDFVDFGLGDATHPLSPIDINEYPPKKLANVSGFLP